MPCINKHFRGDVYRLLSTHSLNIHKLQIIRDDICIADIIFFKNKATPRLIMNQVKKCIEQKKMRANIIKYSYQIVAIL